jgi:hypothetical protein
MTIDAQLPHRSAAELRSADRPTAGIEPRHASICADAFQLLDQRTRGRCVPRRLARPGRYLEVEHREEAPLIPLDEPVIHIGRGLSADLRLEDPHVSRRHAIVAQRGDGARVFDDRSRNGTFVNGRAVTVHYLTDGDVLRVGGGLCFASVRSTSTAT